MTGATSQEDELVALGLTRDEARAYVALLERGRLTARDVSSATGVTRGRIYDVLGGLVAKGAVVEAIGRPRAFEPAPPGAVVANLIASRKAELERIESTAADLAGRLRELADLDKGPLSLIEAVHHPATVATRLDALVREAREEILAFVRPPFFAGLSASDYATQFEALERGVAMRGIYASSLLEREDVTRLVGALQAAGEVSRHVQSVPTKLFLVDRATAVLPLAEAGSPESATTLIVRHPGLAGLLADAFERYWERSMPISAADDAASGATKER